MRLSDLNARFYSYGGDPSRHGQGLLMLCPHCRAIDIPVPFANPIDGGEREPNRKTYWDRTGDTIDTLTISPSVDASGFGCWHGWIRNGETVNA